MRRCWPATPTPTPINRALQVYAEVLQAHADPGLRRLSFDHSDGTRVVLVVH